MSCLSREETIRRRANLLLSLFLSNAFSLHSYNAKEGLYFSHMGWIFHKPVYPRMALVDRKDLDADPVVRFQHRHYLPLTLSLGLVLPTIIGWTYGDAMGGYVWGGVRFGRSDSMETIADALGARSRSSLAF